MKRRSFTRPGRATNIKQTVGLLDGFNDPLPVMRRQPQLVQRDGFTGRQNPHDHVLDATGRRNGGDSQLNIERAILLELDLAVLRLAALGDVEVAHDLDARVIVQLLHDSTCAFLR